MSLIVLDFVLTSNHINADNKYIRQWTGNYVVQFGLKLKSVSRTKTDFETKTNKKWS